MEWIYTEARPAPVETRKRLGMQQRTVNYGVQELAAEGRVGFRYRHKAVTLEPGVWSYGAIVDAIITAEYTGGRMQAVINNYLADPADEEARAEMQQMQQVRLMAKRIAREALELEAWQESR